MAVSPVCCLAGSGMERLITHHRFRQLRLSRECSVFGGVQYRARSTRRTGPGCRAVRAASRRCGVCRERKGDGLNPRVCVEQGPAGGPRSRKLTAAMSMAEAYGGFSPVQKVTDESTIDVLESIPLFSSLLREQLVQLAGALQRREAAQGEDVVRQGDTGDVMYIVESGALEASVAGVGVVMRYGAGAFFGELALVNDEPRRATVTATAASVLLELRRSDVSPLASGEQLKAALEGLEEKYAAALRNQIGSIFKVMDLNQDGTLDALELFKRLSGLDIKEQYIENVFYSMDTCVPHHHNQAVLLQLCLQPCTRCRVPFSILAVL